ncbi:MAG: MmcQ/YjbR family DNA-binding protein [Saprospiraceae bacterium]|nr:MmcQ/YjbR family DNA-binding protein [Saprospiraceae bacterium]
MDIEQLRQLCLSLPSTTEGIKYGDQLCFMVVGKPFCSSRLPDLCNVNFKVSDDQFDELCDRPGITPAPYGGVKFKWVQVADFEALTIVEWEQLLRQAYEEVKAKLPKKVRRGL